MPNLLAFIILEMGPNWPKVAQDEIRAWFSPREPRTKDPIVPSLQNRRAVDRLTCHFAFCEAFLKCLEDKMSCRWSCASLQEGMLAVQSEARVDPAAEEAALLAELQDKPLTKYSFQTQRLSI